MDEINGEKHNPYKYMDSKEKQLLRSLKAELGETLQIERKKTAHMQYKKWYPNFNRKRIVLRYLIPTLAFSVSFCTYIYLLI